MRGVSIWMVVACAGLGCGGGGPPRPSCAVDGECPLHQLCTTAGACRSGCLSSGECAAGQQCGDHGRCDYAQLGDLDGGPAGGDLGVVEDLSVAATPDLASAPPDLAHVDAWICSGVCPDYQLEPNNSPAMATVESDGANLPNLAICPRNDVDWYKVTATKHGVLEATLTNGPCGPALVVDLFAANGTNPIGSSSPVAGGAYASATVAKNQVCYVRVQPASAGDQNFYSLVIDVR